MIKVGIIGIGGKEGEFLRKQFTDFGCAVIGSDIKFNKDLYPSNREVIEQSEVVIFSLPPRVTVEVINSLIEYSRPDQLWMDVASIKVAPIEVMLKSKAEIVGLHPMFAPTAKSFRGQSLIVCIARINKWNEWLGSFLEWTGANIKSSSPYEHDETMAVVQGLVHAMQLTMAATIRSFGVYGKESLNYTSPVYKIALSLIGRILKQNPDLYADIQMLNPCVLDILNVALEELKKLIEIVEGGDVEAFREQFLKNRKYFGEEEITNSFNLFEDIGELLAHKNSAQQISFMATRDEPGLLHKITGIFAEAGINLNHIHSFKEADGNRFQLGLDLPIEFEPVSSAISEIEKLGLIRIRGS